MELSYQIVHRAQIYMLVLHNRIEIEMELNILRLNQMVAQRQFQPNKDTNLLACTAISVLAENRTTHHTEITTTTTETHKPKQNEINPIVKVIFAIVLRAIFES